MVIRAWNFCEYSVSVRDRSRLKGERCCVSGKNFVGEENKSAKVLVSSQGRTLKYNRIRLYLETRLKWSGKFCQKSALFLSNTYIILIFSLF